jgi:hypothetical protein
VIDITMEAKQKVADTLEATAANLKQKRTADAYVELNTRLMNLHSESNSMRIINAAPAVIAPPAAAPAVAPAGEDFIVEDEDEEMLSDEVDEEEDGAAAAAAEDDDDYTPPAAAAAAAAEEDGAFEREGSPAKKQRKNSRKNTKKATAQEAAAGVPVAGAPIQFSPSALGNLNISG